MQIVTTVQPKQCHLWRADITCAEIMYQFTPITVFTESSHYDRMLLACNQCGQLYFYEWLEEIDWENGNDPQYSTWIPIATAHDAEILNTFSSLELLRCTPRLQKDFPSDAKVPTARWIGYCN